jgi:hypothetical protein
VRGGALSLSTAFKSSAVMRVVNGFEKIKMAIVVRFDWAKI